VFLKIWAVKLKMEYNWLTIENSDIVIPCGIKYSDPKTRRHLLVVKIYQNDAVYIFKIPP
jgi:hypothetical protein